MTERGGGGNPWFGNHLMVGNTCVLCLFYVYLFCNFMLFYLILCNLRGFIEFYEILCNFTKFYAMPFCTIFCYFTSSKGFSTLSQKTITQIDCFIMNFDAC